MRSLVRHIMQGLAVGAMIALLACDGSTGTTPVYETNVDVFMLRFNSNNNPAGTPDYRYCVESVIDDPHGVIASASLTGMGRTSGFAFNSTTQKWWDDAASRYCTQVLPVFPLNYTVFVSFVGGRTETFQRAVTSWSAAP